MSTKHPVTWQWAFISCNIPLACSFLVAHNTLWSKCLLAVRCSLLCKKVLEIAIFLSYAVNTSSVSAWCVNIQFLPCKSPRFSTLFRRKTRLKYAVSCQSVFNTSCNIPLSRHFTSQILPKYTRFMLLYARNSRVFRAVNAPRTHCKSPVFCPYFARNLPTKVPANMPI